MPVRIVTDSACDLSPSQAAALGIEIVPLTIRFGTEEFVDREELTVDDFYRRMASSVELPETAAPSPGAFEAAFRRCVDQGADAIVCVNLSAKLSATMQSAQTGAKAFDGEVDVRVVDSRSVTAGLGSMATAAAEAALDGKSADDVVALVEDLRARQRVWATLDTLDNLKKGGRIGGARAFLAQVLSIKPAIAMHDGEVEEAGKPRTRRKALQWLADKLLAEPAAERINVVHGQAPDLELFLDLLSTRYTRDELHVSVIGPVIGAHGGPRVVGVTYQVPR